MISYSVSPDLKVKSPADLLADLPEVVLVNKFNEDGAEKFRTSFNKALQSKQPIVPIVIDSFGGQVYALLSMLDIIKASTKPVATIVQGKAMSCGAILFSAGKEGFRFMGPSATVLIHDVSSWASGKVEEVKADAAETERLNHLIYTMLANNCGKPDNYFLELVHKRGHADWFLNAEECKEHNLANHIRIPTLKIQIDLKMELL